MILVFWISLALILYAYAGYPCLLLVLSSLHQVGRDLRFAFRRNERRSVVPETLPAVSLVFSAFNEEALIGQKLANCAALDYPADCLEVLVGCDGCSDRTAELARSFAGPNAHIFDYASRRGKPSVINELVTHATGEIVVFSDANTMLKRDALLQLVRHFSSDRVGCVCGELTFAPAPDGTPTEGMYWRYEVLLKFLESRLNMMVGANGGLYAVRRSPYTPIPLYGIIDDFLVSMAVRQKGYRLVYDPEATAVEDAAASVGDEFRRRVRIGAGNFYALRYVWPLLSPTAGLVSLALWSHKVLRWLVPFALIAALISGMTLMSQPFYAASVLAALALTAMAGLGYRRERTRSHMGLFGIPYYFLSMNLALALGLYRCLTATQAAAWTRTPRESTTGAGQ